LRPLLKALFYRLVIFHQVRIHTGQCCIDLYTSGRVIGKKLYLKIWLQKEPTTTAKKKKTKKKPQKTQNAII
jgi:hypothetical protein